MPDFGIFRGFNEKLFSDKLFAGQLPTQLGGEIDADAQDFFYRVTTAGGSLSATEKLAINIFVLELKNYGLWSKMKAIYPMVGASAAACAQNLKSSSFTMAFTSGWTFANTGVTGNGTSAYANTNLIPNISLNRYSQSLFVYSRTNFSSSDCWDMGANNVGRTVKTNITYRWGDGNSYGSSNSVTNIFVSATTTLGFYGMSRQSDVLTKLYKNGSPIQTSTAVTLGNVDNSLYLAWVNNETYLRYSPRQYAYSSIGDGLTDSEVTNLYNAVQAFQTTLSRNV